jgi:hypothetical protein
VTAALLLSGAFGLSIVGLLVVLVIVLIILKIFGVI